jgi:hypothetical protein
MSNRLILRLRVKLKIRMLRPRPRHRKLRPINFPRKLRMRLNKHTRDTLKLRNNLMSPKIPLLRSNQRHNKISKASNKKFKTLRKNLKQ